MKTALAVIVLILAIVALPIFLSPPPDNQTGKPVEGLPWQIEALPDGQSRVAGLTLGTTTVADVRQRFGDDMEVAIVTAPGEAGTVEAYFSDAAFGPVTGKLIATADIAAATFERMRQRSTKTEYMGSSTKKSTVHPDDLPAIYAAPIRALAFIPAVNLDEAIVVQRFGTPAERVRTSEHTEHFLYPAHGLDVVLDSEGKELLQYVAPRRFAELRAPLTQQTASSQGNTQ